MRLQDLYAEKKSRVDALEAILKKATDEKRSLSEDEVQKYDTIETEVRQLDETITREERVAKLRADQAAIANMYHGAGEQAAKEPEDDNFRNLGDFIKAVATRDKRLSKVEERAQSVSDGTTGGFAVPKQFVDTLLQVSPQSAIFRPRATVIPAGTPPDAAVTMPALDQSTAKNVYGGMTVGWINEGDTKADTTGYIREITLTPHEVAGSFKTTDKLIRNAPAFSGMLQQMLRACVIGAEETAFYTGNGVGKPLGIVNSPATIGINRGTANQISWTDISNMFARLKMGGSPVWIASQTIIPQLVNIKDSNNNNLFVTQFGNASNSVPQSLMGYPIVWADRAPTLGTKGDLSLVDLSYYLIKDGSGPFLATDNGIVNFLTNQTLVKVFWNVDGQSWLNTPLLLEGSTTSTVSPFVTLDTP